MRGEPGLLIALDITHDKDIEAGLAGDVGADGVDGHENGPGDGPDGEEDDGHGAEEADEEIGVHAVDGDDVCVVGIEDGQRPAKEGGGELLDALAGDRGETAGFINGLESGAKDSKSDNFSGEYGAVEPESGEERRGGGGLGRRLCRRVTPAILVSIYFSRRGGAYMAEGAKECECKTSVKVVDKRNSQSRNDGDESGLVRSQSGLTVYGILSIPLSSILGQPPSRIADPSCASS